MSKYAWFTCPCITVISSTQSGLSKLKENLSNSSQLSWTSYLQMASSVLFKFSCTSSELFSITLISFSSQIMYLGRRKRPMSWSKVHIIRKLFKLAAHQIFEFTSTEKWWLEIELWELQYIYIFNCDIFWVNEIIEINNKCLRIYEKRLKIEIRYWKRENDINITFFPSNF